MKKYVAYNHFRRTSCFCKYELMKTGILRVEYYLPKSGFSVIYDKKNPLCRISGIKETADGRKSIVTYLIHPCYWMGQNFNDYFYDNIFNAMNICFINNIGLL